MLLQNIYLELFNHVLCFVLLNELNLGFFVHYLILIRHYSKYFKYHPQINIFFECTCDCHEFIKKNSVFRYNQYLQLNILIEVKYKYFIFR